jgi:hypothetical protein
MEILPGLSLPKSLYLYARYCNLFRMNNPTSQLSPHRSVYMLSVTVVLVLLQSFVKSTTIVTLLSLNNWSVVMQVAYALKCCVRKRNDLVGHVFLG